MKKILTVIAASTALGVVIGLPAWSAMHHDGEHFVLREAGRFDLARSDDARSDREHGRSRLWLASDDDDDRGHNRVRYEDDDDDDGRSGMQANPAPVGTVSPPSNGLFGNGTPPRVQVN